MKKVKF